jgi:hypothetical protein
LRAQGAAAIEHLDYSNRCEIPGAAPTTL